MSNAQHVVMEQINLPDNSISTLAYYILNVILLADIKRDFAGSRRIRSGRTRHGLWYVLKKRLSEESNVRKDQSQSEVLGNRS